MSRSQQVIDDESGEVLSHKTIPNNRDFVMTFRPAYKKLRDIGFKDPKARILFDFLLEKMDTENALIVSRHTIKEIMGWSIATIDRKIKVLRDEKCIDVKRTGGTNVYLVNADLAWTTHSDKRQYAHFRANVFIGESEQDSPEREDVKAERRKRVYVEN